MEHSTAQRRLVKSPPELWAEVSSEDILGRHLAPFGEIRITRVEPETTVAWEGDRASGTVELAPAGWGTKVTLTAQHAERAAACTAPPAAPEPPRAALPATPPAVREPAPPLAAPALPVAPGLLTDQPKHAGFLARLLRRRAAEAGQPAPAPPQPRAPALGPPLPPPPPAPAPPPPAPPARTPGPGLDSPGTEAILLEALDRLGGTHRRSFARD
jgi:hypothetical protein